MEINIQNTELVITAGLSSQFPDDALPQIAFSGRSNVGKSSLINMLLGRRKLARVSSAPGKTITVNFYRVDNTFYLVDLPGYGFARRAPEDKKRWSQLTDAYFRDNDRLCLVTQLIDLGIGPTADDDIMLKWLYEMRMPYIIAATKADKLNVTNRRAALEKLERDRMLLGGTRVIPCSTLRKEGADGIYDAIFHVLSRGDGTENGSTKC